MRDECVYFPEKDAYFNFFLIVQVEKVDMKLRYAFVYMPAKDAKLAVASVRGDDKVPPPLIHTRMHTLAQHTYMHIHTHILKKNMHAHTHKYGCAYT